jgi:hypothetical protein
MDEKLEVKPETKPETKIKSKKNYRLIIDIVVIIAVLIIGIFIGSHCHRFDQKGYRYQGQGEAQDFRGQHNRRGNMPDQNNVPDQNNAPDQAVNGDQNDGQQPTEETDQPTHRSGNDSNKVYIQNETEPDAAAPQAQTCTGKGCNGQGHQAK